MGTPKPKSFDAVITDDDLILLFYKVAVSSKSTSFQSTSKKEFENLQKKIGFSVEFIDHNKAVRNSNTADCFIIGHEGTPKFYFGEFLRHMRNAFCHNNVKLNADGTYRLQDYQLNKKTKRQQRTMSANIDANKLKTILSELQKLKK